VGGDDPDSFTVVWDCIAAATVMPQGACGRWGHTAVSFTSQGSPQRRGEGLSWFQNFALAASPRFKFLLCG